jgi:nitrite reductase (NO-forming)
MEAQFLVTPQAPPQTVTEADISHLASDVPPPIGKPPPQAVQVDLVTIELEARLAEGTTFARLHPLQAKVGDTVRIFLASLARITPRRSMSSAKISTRFTIWVAC